MNFNTVILYDIENLMGGYSKAGYLSELSLKDIYDEVLKKDISGIAIQRAYANWSDSRLNILRGDIVELGIEPIQMFGFGRGPDKNASDIQLAIDAIEILFTKSAIERFVIVSGDGGFSSLAKKLHEYGKMVIGCAYAKTTNKVFEAVCDDFIWIDLPEEVVSSSKQFAKTYGSYKKKGSADSTPTLTEFSRKYAQLETNNKQDIFKESKDVYSFLLEAKTTRNIAENSGINIGIVNQLLNYRIKDFNFIKYGFSRFVDYIRFTVTDTDAKLVLKEPSDYRLVHKAVELEGFKAVENITEEPELHSSDNYKQLLARLTPRFPLPSRSVLYELAQYYVLNKNEIINKSYGDLVDIVSTSFELEQKAIRGCITCLVSSNCFVEVEESKVDDRHYSFICTSVEDTINLLRDALKRKLLTILEEINEDVLESLLPKIKSEESV